MVSPAKGAIDLTVRRRRVVAGVGAPPWPLVFAAPPGHPWPIAPAVVAPARCRCPPAPPRIATHAAFPAASPERGGSPAALASAVVLPVRAYPPVLSAAPARPIRPIP